MTRASAAGSAASRSSGFRQPRSRPQGSRSRGLVVQCGDQQQRRESRRAGQTHERRMRARAARSTAAARHDPLRPSCPTRGSSMSASGLPAASRSTRLRAASGSAGADASNSAAAVASSRARQPVLRQPGVREHRRVTVAHGRQQEDRVGLDPPSDEREHLLRRAVEPVRVFGDSSSGASSATSDRRSSAAIAIRKGSGRASG